LIETSALKLIEILAASGHETRFVGGAVRDAMLGLSISDVDLATTALPDEVSAQLGAAGIKTVPTGLAHGTLTAVVEGEGIEITTLREDSETDGRHAVVTFTKDWEKDAARRDFTFNALSRDAHGRIYDYFGGADDLRLGRVRFVGDATARIREDYLRLLRFFRFHAWFGRVEPDEKTLNALTVAAPQLATLSRERVWKELSKLLAAADPSETIMLMLQKGITKHLLPEADRLATMCSLISYEHMRKKKQAPNPLLRLAALLTGKKVSAEKLQKRFALSTAETQNLAHYLANPLVFDGQFNAANLSFCLYRYGFDLTEDFLVLAQAQAAQFNWESAKPVLEKWVPKSFPLRGEDLLALGLSPGPRIGKILHAVENWWMAQNFVPDQAACLQQARKLIEE
jgi:poly(A) polymerase